MPEIGVTRTDEAPQRTPALLGSLLLHGGLLALVFIAVKTAPPLHIETEPVAVSIVSGEPNVAPALKSKEIAPPQAEESAPGLALPGPEAVEPKPAPPAAAVPPPPQVAPPKPTPAPMSAPKAAPLKRQVLDPTSLTANLPSARRPEVSDPSQLVRGLSPENSRTSRDSGEGLLDRIAADPSAGRRAGNGTKGPPRPETAPQARPTGGGAAGLSSSELGALQAKLRRLWTPNCGLEGVQSIVVKISFGLGPDGRITSLPQVTAKSGSVSPDVLNAAALRAVSAVNRGQPFDELSAETLRAFGTRTVVFSKPCQ